MTSITLPSGAELKVAPASFAVSKALYQAVLEEAKGLKISATDEVDVNLFKDLFCVGFSSKRIDICLSDCLKKCTYNGVKITDETFEPVDARQDYATVLWEVALANLLPFTKNLHLYFKQITEIIQKSPVSK